MKLQKMIRWTVMGTVALMSMTGFAFERMGTERGNGGDLVRLEFIKKGREILSYINSVDPSIIRDCHLIDDLCDLSFANLESTLTIQKIITVQGPIKDNGGAIVDARMIHDRIELDQQAWKEIFLRDRNAYSLIFHEMIRLASKAPGLDDDYVISKALDNVNVTAVPSSDRGVADLLNDVRLGNIDFVKYWLDSGTWVNSRDVNGKTLLMVAIESKKDKVARLLLERGAFLNAVTAKKETALSIAVKTKNILMIKHLIDSGADLNGGDGQPLWEAVTGAGVEIGRILLEAGANPHQRDYMAKAIYYYGISFEPLLIEFGVAPDIYKAVQDGRREVLEYFLSLTKEIPDGAFEWALGEEEYEIAELLSKAGAKFSPSTRMEEVVPYLVKKNKLGALRLAIKHGAPLDTENSSLLETAAIKHRNAEMVGFLLENGVVVKASLGTKDYRKSRGVFDVLYKNTTLSFTNCDFLEYAAINGMSDLVKNLLERGAVVNCDNGSPLGQAFRYKEFEMVRLLIQSGAQRVDFWDYEKRMKELKEFVLSKNMDMVMLYLSASKGVTEEVFALVIENDMDEAVRSILESGQLQKYGYKHGKILASVNRDLFLSTVIEKKKHSWDSWLVGEGLERLDMKVIHAGLELDHDVKLDKFVYKLLRTKKKELIKKFGSDQYKELKRRIKFRI